MAALERHPHLVAAPYDEIPIVPIFSGFAAPALAERLRDAGARLLFTADETIRRSTPVPIKPNADLAARDVPTLERVVVVRRGSSPLMWHEGRDVTWDDFLASGGGAPATEPMDSMEPALILYAVHPPGTDSPSCLAR